MSTRKAAVAVADKKIRKVTKSCPVQLTVGERLATGDEMARSTQELQRATDRKKEVGSQLAADVEAARANVVRLGQLLSNGYEYRDVECVETIDFAAGMVTVTRCDNDEVATRRPARPEELQPELALDHNVE